MHEIAHEALRTNLDEMWAVCLDRTDVWGAIGRTLRKNRQKNPENGDVAPFCDGCHTGTKCCPERLKLVWSLDKMYIETEQSSNWKRRTAGSQNIVILVKKRQNLGHF